MAAYVDTGLLLKIYVNEADSAQALALVQSLSGPLLFTRLHRAEAVNTLRCKEGRRDLTGGDVAKILADMRADLRSGFLVLCELDWNRVFAATARLSHAHGAKTLCRTLDAIHVSAALQLGAAEFATKDHRQIAMAKASGLKVLTF
jgi:predicted nucleic acid-binding protein